MEDNKSYFELHVISLLEAEHGQIQKATTKMWS